MGRMRRFFGASGRQAPAAFSLTHPLSEVLTESFLETSSDAVAGSQTVALGVANEVTTALPMTALSNAIPAVIYDGAFDFLKHTGGPAGATDGTTGTFAWAGTFNSDGSAMTLIDIPGTVPVKLERQPDNTIDFVVGTAGAVCSNSTAAVASSLGFLIVLASFSGTTSHLYVIHSAGTITGVNTAGTSASVDLTADWFLGADGGASSFLDADVSMWWADDSFIDFSVSNNREEFWDTTNGLLRDPGSDGSNPSGTQPLVCHVEYAANHLANRGTGGDADTGSLTEDGTSPGAYAADYSPSAPASIAFTSGTYGSGSVNQISYTFNSVDIGAENDDRVVAIGVCAEGGGAIVSVTMDTVSMNLSGQASGNGIQTLIAWLPKMTGTTATIVVTLTTATGNSCGIIPHIVITKTPTPTDIGNDPDSGTTHDLAGTFTVPANGVALLFSAVHIPSHTCTWTGATETQDISQDFRHCRSTATITTATETSPSIQAAWTGGGGALVGVAWRS